MIQKRRKYERKIFIIFRNLYRKPITRSDSRYEFTINRVDFLNQNEDYNGKFGFIICNLQIIDESEEII